MPSSGLHYQQSTWILEHMDAHAGLTVGPMTAYSMPVQSADGTTVSVSERH
jgi:hypothetical protein